MKYKVKVTCYTPKGKSKKCETEWRKQFPSFKKPVKVGIPSGSQFFWIYEFNKDKDVYIFQKKCILAEQSIRKVYGFMIRFFNRANKLMSKSAWTAKKVKNWLIKRWKKSVSGNEDEIDKLKSMDEETFKEYIKIEDLEQMKKFLSREELIKVEILGDEND